MGNCMETCLPRSSEEAQEEEHGELETTTYYTTYPQKQRPGSADEDEEVQDGVLNRSGDKEVSEIGKGDGGGSLRVKIVLTKEELHWLLMQLKSDGEKRLENVLKEIEIGREKVGYDDGCRKKCIGWKPSLESIMETPEVLEMDRSMRL